MLKKQSLSHLTLLILLTITTFIHKATTLSPIPSTVPLLFFHFNDAYDLQILESQPKAGAAYFKSLLDRHRNQYHDKSPYLSPSQYSLTLFSGDVYAPSMLSRQYHGQNMIRPLNQLGIDAATFGNHQFDYPLARIIQLTKKNNFTWINSNMIDKRTGEILADGKQYQIFVRNNNKICFFSLTQQKLLDLLIPQYFDITQILPFVPYARIMVNKMRELKCDLIIALTHMTLANDRQLARQVDGIDIILGGHDHLIAHEQIGNTVIIKSGADFKHFSKLKLFMKKSFTDLSLIEDSVHDHRFQTQKFIVFTTLLEVHHTKYNITPDPSIHQYVSQLYQKMRLNQQRTALFTLQPINLNFSHIRTEYSPYLTFIAELYKHAARADCAIVNSGAFRASAQFKAGEISYATFMNFIKDEITVKVLTGEQIYKALDNSVSMYPSHAGRYSQVAGIQFVWDRSKAPNQRVLKNSIKINGNPLQTQRKYRVAFRDYISKGADGFLFLKSIPYAQNNYPIPMLTIMSEYIQLDHSNLLRGFPYRHATSTKVVNGTEHAVLDLSVFEKPRIVMIDSSVVAGTVSVPEPVHNIKVEENGQKNRQNKKNQQL